VGERAPAERGGARRRRREGPGGGGGERLASGIRDALRTLARYVGRARRKGATDEAERPAPDPQGRPGTALDVEQRAFVAAVSARMRAHRPLKRTSTDGTLRAGPAGQRELERAAVARRASLGVGALSGSRREGDEREEGEETVEPVPAASRMRTSADQERVIARVRGVSGGERCAQRHSERPPKLAQAGCSHRPRNEAAGQEPPSLDCARRFAAPLSEERHMTHLLEKPPVSRRMK